MKKIKAVFPNGITKFALARVFTCKFAKEEADKYGFDNEEYEYIIVEARKRIERNPEGLLDYIKSHQWDDIKNLFSTDVHELFYWNDDNVELEIIDEQDRSV